LTGWLAPVARGALHVASMIEKWLMSNSCRPQEFFLMNLRFDFGFN